MIIKKTKALKALSIPGVFTPTEIANAYDVGADYVKIFPAGELGPNYIKTVRGPISHIPMLAVGGINKENIKDYLSVGIEGVGIGSNIVDRNLIDQGKFEELTKLAKEYTEQI